MSVATECVREMLDRNAYRVVHIDTADRRGLANVGKLDVMNVLLALRHGARFATLLLTNRAAAGGGPLARKAMGERGGCRCRGRGRRGRPRSLRLAARLHALCYRRERPF